MDKEVVIRIGWDVLGSMAGACVALLFIMYIALTGEIPGLN